MREMNKILVNEKVFHPTKIALSDQVKKFQKMADEETQQPINLEEIITAQVDEPTQKRCIYRVKQNVQKSSQKLTENIYLQ